MPQTTAPRDIPRLRLLSHGLLPADGFPRPELESPEDVVRWMTAQQGQDWYSVPWSIGARQVFGAATSVQARAASAAAVRQAFQDGRIVRSWPMRGTLHTLLPEDLVLFHSLTSERLISSMATRHRQLGITADDGEKARAAVVGSLRGGGSASRANVFAVLEAAGQGTKAQRGAHLLHLLSITGTLVQGPIDGKEHLFALQDEWIGDRRRDLAPEAALDELLERYVRSHGPATLRDFSWWTGLTLSACRAARERLGDRLREYDAGLLLSAEAADWLEARDGVPLPGARAFHLLAGFDEYILGYTDRSAVLDAGHFELIVPGGNGMFKRTTMSGGVTDGTWSTDSRGAVVLEPFAVNGERPAPHRSSETRAAAYLRFMNR
ncbi:MULTISPECIES: winged helix DNA-binding domain-containing protein [Arthrobacter]|uniref:Winged helix DNA-binding domain-containing protein n=2 Tax=Arthrobacter TaxID=1663 RepID=A0ABU9KRN5_9MICC|nr:winged helix DNA-binding domain-containing protein [Arthrobacter sp. YJM1]MDP5227928.1 winged helix DNA-binding domain-containing protein [Arthrobacter sp. YJM1]